MKFKVGDRVKVREDLGVFEPTSEVLIHEDMAELAGQEVIIGEVFENIERYEINDNFWFWTDEMLEPIEDPLADKIMERNQKPEEDLVNHPAHYNQGSMETIEKIKLLLTEEEYIGFLKGNIIKYDDRMNHKGDAENDLRKSKWYAERLRKTYYGGTNPND